MVRWSGPARPAAFLSASRQTAAIAAVDLTTGGTSTAGVPITVSNPDGSVTTPGNFTVIALPAITALSPPSTVAGGFGLTLTVEVNGVARDALPQGNTGLAVPIIGCDLATAGGKTATVVNPDGSRSNTVLLRVCSGPC